MAMSPKLDLASHIKNFFVSSANDTPATPSSGANVLIVAGDARDGVEIVGEDIDRRDATGGISRSCVLSTQWSAGLADTETLSLTHRLQESDDGVTYDAAVSIEAVTVKATASGAEDLFGIDEHTVSLEGRKQFIRFLVTPTLSAGSLDTCHVASQAILGGWDNTPVV